MFYAFYAFIQVQAAQLKVSIAMTIESRSILQSALHAAGTLQKVQADVFKEHTDVQS
jgi:hypothetical protein